MPVWLYVEFLSEHSVLLQEQPRSVWQALESEQNIVLISIRLLADNIP